MALHEKITSVLIKENYGCRLNILQENLLNQTRKMQIKHITRKLVEPNQKNAEVNGTSTKTHIEKKIVNVVTTDHERRNLSKYLSLLL
jgi:hypothetical protein